MAANIHFVPSEMIAENIEGRERYPVNVRYSRDFRDNVEELQRVLIGTPSGAQIPISEVAKVSFSRGPSMIRDEDGALTGYVYIDLNTKYSRYFSSVVPKVRLADAP
jgi:copper/silver efflux system protein